MTHHSPKLFLHALGKRPFWMAAVNIPAWFHRPAEVFRRYVFGSGAYPWEVRIRTPIGPRTVTLYSHHDMLTVVECFAKLDYRAPRTISCVVDVGANIGLSALYFLTRNRDVRAYLYEPVTRNADRLRANIVGLEQRYALHEVAVAPRAGEVSFAVEPTGRYGGVITETYRRNHGLAEATEVRVRAESINTVLEQAIQRHGRVDILKVDVEFLEVELLRAIEPALLSRLGRIYAEDAFEVTLPGFRKSRYGNIARFYNSGLPR